MKRPVTLLETVPYMIDERSEYRLIGEYFQTKIRLEKLKEYFGRIHNFCDDNMAKIMHRQMAAMDYYVDAMKESLLYLGIDRIIEGGL